MRICFYLFFFISTTALSQSIQGTVYDPHEEELPYLEVWNKTKQTSTTTDIKGFFQLAAKTGDSIVFKSLIYEEQILVVTQKHLDKLISIKLKEKINELNEVKVIGFKTEFDLEKFNEDFRSMIKNDRDKNPFLYQKAPNGQPDFIKIAGLLLDKLFKSEKTESPKRLSYQDFHELFRTDKMFNDKFLTSQLEIPLALKNLYFDYLGSLSWNAELLEDANKLDLIQKLYESSVSYRERVDTDN